MSIEAERHEKLCPTWCSYNIELHTVIHAIDKNSPNLSSFAEDGFHGYVADYFTY